MIVLVVGSSETGSAKFAKVEPHEDPYPRWVQGHADFEDSERLVFCEMEKEVRENESKDGEDNFFDEVPYVGTETGGRLTIQSLRTILSIRMRSVESIYSRLHLLRC
ncbi:hypothetical protein GC170_10640 [bacterium]|nr:hypothetical protein [bacterium]